MPPDFAHLVRDRGCVVLRKVVRKSKLQHGKRKLKTTPHAIQALVNGLMRSLSVGASGGLKLKFKSDLTQLCSKL